MTMSGRTCLVTGATSGIGKETAIRLASLGANVVVVARDAVRGGAAGEDIRRLAPLARVDTLTADLSSMAQVRRLADEVRARYDRLDVLVNNAGTITMRRQLTADGLEAMFATNHLGPFLLTNLLRGLLERSAPAPAPASPPTACTPASCAPNSVGTSRAWSVTCCGCSCVCGPAPRPVPARRCTLPPRPRSPTRPVATSSTASGPSRAAWPRTPGPQSGCGR